MVQVEPALVLMATEELAPAATGVVTASIATPSWAFGPGCTGLGKALGWVSVLAWAGLAAGLGAD